MNTTTTTRLADLTPNTFFTLDGRDYRVVWHWSTGVEVEQVASWGADETSVLPATTVVVEN